MNDFRNQLQSAAGSPPLPDPDDLWAKGRRAAHRRWIAMGTAALVLVVGIGFVITQAGSDERAELDVRGDGDESTVEIAEPLPVIEVPEGVELTMYPVGLDDWDIRVLPPDEGHGNPTSLSIHSPSTGESAFIVVTEPRPRIDVLTEAPLVQEFQWGDSWSEVDLGFDDDVQHEEGWQGPEHQGSLLVVGDTDPRTLAADLFDSDLFNNAGGLPPPGWDLGLDTRLTTGGGRVYAEPPGSDGAPQPRLTTLLFDDPPSAAQFSSFGNFAPAATERTVAGLQAYQWNDLVVFNDNKGIHVVDYPSDADPDILDAFLDALRPVTSVDTLPAIPDDPAEITGSTTTGGPTTGPVVPSVIGLSQEKATAALAELGYATEVVAIADVQATGIVVGQTPTAGTPHSLDEPVELQISAGPEQIIVPDLEGLTLTEAITLLNTMGMTAEGEPVLEASVDIEESRITRTEPASQSLVPVGSAITLYQSSGVPTVEVPALAGLFFDQAQTILIGLGLEPVVQLQTVPFGDPLIGLVIDQTPAQFGRVEVGAEVVVIVGEAGPASD